MAAAKKKYIVICDGVMTTAGRKARGSVLELTATQAAALPGLIEPANATAEADDDTNKEGGDGEGTVADDGAATKTVATKTDAKTSRAAKK